MSETTKRKITKLSIIITDQEGTVLNQIYSTEYDLRLNVHMNAFVDEIRQALENAFLAPDVDYEPEGTSMAQIAGAVWNAMSIGKRVAILRHQSMASVLRHPLPHEVPMIASMQWQEISEVVRAALVQNFDQVVW